jgi:hypothetical protein
LQEFPYKGLESMSKPRKLKEYTVVGRPHHDKTVAMRFPQAYTLLNLYHPEILGLPQAYNIHSLRAAPWDTLRDYLSLT